MDDDENREKGRKTNTDRDFKPRHEKRNERAPRGMMGRPAASMSGPGLGTSSVNRVADSSERQEPKKHIDPPKDTRPVFHETGDKETDKFYQKSHRMIPKDQAAKGVVADRPKVSQSAFAKSFRQARDQAPKVNKPKGPEID